MSTDTGDDLYLRWVSLILDDYIPMDEAGMQNRIGSPLLWLRLYFLMFRFYILVKTYTVH